MKNSFQFAVAATTLIVSSFVPALVVAQHPRVKVSNVRRVFNDGHHNAFTDMIRWQGKLWLTFRSCPDGHMVHPTSSIIILSSEDGKKWKPAHQFSVTKRDTRDPHFLVFNDKLFVYTGTWYCGETSPRRIDYTLNQHLGYAVSTDDGKNWRLPIMLEGTFGHYIWRAGSFGDKAYLCGRRNHEFDTVARGEGDAVESVMLESDDGLVWKTRALFQVDHGNETAFLFEPDGDVLAIGRGVDGPAQILRSPPPYSMWKRRKLDRDIGGPLVVKWGERIVVAGRNTLQRPDAKRGPKTSFYWLDPDAQKTSKLLSEFADVRSGGDNSYPGFVAISPTEALVSWYSSHEFDKRGEPMTAIYLANLKIEK